MGGEVTPCRFAPGYCCLIVGMVATLSLVLLAIQINTLVSVWLNHSAERAASTSQFIKTYVTERAHGTGGGSCRPPASPRRPRWLTASPLWRTVITSDNELPGTC